MKNIVLYGMRGSGKTTIGRELSKSIGYCFYDLDNVIAEKIGVPIFDFINTNGWDEFRKVESSCIKELLKKEGNKIISLGGGTLCYFDNADFIKSNSDKLIYIRSSIDDICSRIHKDERKGNKRNSLNGNCLISEIEDVYNSRKEIFESYFTFSVNNNSSIDNVLSEIKCNLKIGNLCVPISNFSDSGISEYKNLSKKSGIVRYLEVRIDNDNGELNNEKMKIIQNTYFKKIITNRHSDENGGFNGTYRESVNNLLKFSDLGDLFDIELAAGESINYLKNNLPRSKKIIISYHNFSITPDLDDMKEIIKKMEKYSPDIYKIAVMPNSSEDVHIIYELQKYLNMYHKDKKYILISMGYIGEETRYEVLKRGGEIGFTSLGSNISAPGQLSYLEMYNKLYNFK